MRLERSKEESGGGDESVTVRLVFFLERPHIFFGDPLSIRCEGCGAGRGGGPCLPGCAFPWGDGTDTSVSAGYDKGKRETIPD